MPRIKPAPTTIQSNLPAEFLTPEARTLVERVKHKSELNDKELLMLAMVAAQAAHAYVITGRRARSLEARRVRNEASSIFAAPKSRFWWCPAGRRLFNRHSRTVIPTVEGGTGNAEFSSMRRRQMRLLDEPG